MGRIVISAAGVLTALGVAPAQAESLDEVIAASLAHSPALAAAQAKEDAADATLDQARAERMPSAAAQAQIGVGRIDPQGFFGLAADGTVPRTARLTADLPIFTGGRITAAETQAQAGRALAGEASRSTAIALRLQVVTAYAQAMTADQEVSSYVKLGEALAELVRQARLKFAAGEGTSTEVAQAEARRAEAVAGLAAAQGRLEAARASLSFLAGHEVKPDAALPPPPLVPGTLAEALDLALADNPLLGQARRAAQIARSDVSSARAENMPTVGIYAEAASVRDQFFPGYSADSASLGVRASWTFFSGGRVRAKVERASAEARAAEAAAEAAAQDIERQTVESFTAWRSAVAQLAAAESRAAATSEALRGTRLEVEAGAKPMLALLDAEREMIAADTARIDAAGRLLIAVNTLRAVTGLTD